MRQLLRKTLLLLGLSVVYVTESAACSCSHGQEHPAMGERAPRDTKLWLPKQSAEDLVWLFERATKTNSIRLEHAAKEVQTFGARLTAALKLSGPQKDDIPFRVAELHFGGIGDFVAIEPLSMLDFGDHRLRVRAKREGDLSAVAGDENLLFTVAPDEAVPPRIPTASIERWTRDDAPGMCRDRKAVHLRLEHFGWLVAYEVYKPSERGNPPPQALHYLQPQGNELTIGDGACGAYWKFNEEPAVVRFGTLDLAGRFSGWSPELALEPPWPMHESKSAYAMSATISRVENRRGCGCYLQDSSQEASRRSSRVLLAFRWSVREDKAPTSVSAFT